MNAGNSSNKMERCSVTMVRKRPDLKNDVADKCILKPSGSICSVVQCTEPGVHDIDHTCNSIRCML